METIRILALGDIVGKGAVDKFCRSIRNFISAEKIDATVVNGENAYPGNGIDPQSAHALLDAGADVITTGNHVFRRYEIADMLNDGDRLIRPANYPPEAPGFGYTTVPVGARKMLVINVMGVVYMDPLENPFRCVGRILEREKGTYDFSVLDIHAEATSEKIALGRYFDGKINIIYGTHTHVQTADEQVLPHGSGYITDLGMCGPDDSVLGVRTDRIIAKMTTMMPQKFDLADGKVTMHGAVFELDADSGKVTTVKRVSF